MIRRLIARLDRWLRGPEPISLYELQEQRKRGEKFYNVQRGGK